MPNGPSSDNNDAAAATADFTGNSENTMSVVLSNSVGMLLLQLKNHYFPEASESEMDQHYEDCLKMLRALPQSDVIENFIRLADEPPDPFLDTLTLCLPDEKRSEKYIFRLKDVLTLVWAALNDDEKFTHHYDGAPAEKLQQAEQDRPNRIRSFFASLDKIKTERPCHLGIRNELVFLLNETYEGVHLIEDARSTVHAFLKEKIHEGFWRAYEKSQTSNEKRVLTSALFTWMADADAQAILKIVDPQNTILFSLNNFFIEHGIYPRDIRLDTLIQQALLSLEFSCNPTVSPMLFDINEILNTLEGKDPAERAALERMQRWIQSDCQLQEETDQRNVHDFYRIDRAHRDLTHYRLLLALDGKFDAFKGLLDECDRYFRDFGEATTIPCAPEGIMDQVVALNEVVNACKRNTMVDQVENYFAHFITAHDNNDTATLQQRYAMLLDKTVQEKILLTDEEINHFIRSNPAISEGVIDVTPYWINRVFLHAILTPPQEWSSRFAEVFHCTRCFVEDSFNQDHNGRATSLRENSYPAELRDQLAYLEACWRATYSEEPTELPTRPRDMILLPRDVRNIDEWGIVCFLLDEETFERVYVSMAARIRPLLVVALESNPLSFILRLIPKSHRLRFALDHKDKIQDGNQLASVLEELREDQQLELAIACKEIIQDGHQLASVLEVLPEDQRRKFAEAHNGLIREFDQLGDVLRWLPKDQRLKLAIACKNRIQSGEQLVSVLRTFPEGERKGFAENQKYKIKNSEELVWVLECLPKNQRLEFAALCILLFEEIVQDGFQLGDVLKTLPNDQRWELAIACRELIKGGHQLSDVLKHLPEEQRLKFAEDQEGEIQDGAGLASVLAYLPDAERLRFAKDQEGKIRSGGGLASVLAHLPDAKRLRFAENHEDLIQQGEQLALVLASLLDDDVRLRFAKDRKSKIQDSNELFSVLDRLPDNKRLEFAKGCKEKIHGSYQLKSVLRYLPRGDRFEFAILCKEEIKDNYSLDFVVTSLPVDKREEFTTIYEDHAVRSDGQLLTRIGTFRLPSSLGPECIDQPKISPCL